MGLQIGHQLSEWSILQCNAERATINKPNESIMLESNQLWTWISHQINWINGNINTIPVTIESNHPNQIESKTQESRSNENHPTFIYNVNNNNNNNKGQGSRPGSASSTSGPLSALEMLDRPLFSRESEIRCTSSVQVIAFSLEVCCSRLSSSSFMMSSTWFFLRQFSLVSRKSFETRHKNQWSTSRIRNQKSESWNMSPVSQKSFEIRIHTGVTGVLKWKCQRSNRKNITST